MKLTAVISEEALSTGEVGYVALCPEIDVVSQGDTKAEALANLKEALEGFFEVAEPAEISRRFAHGATVQQLEFVA